MTQRLLVKLDTLKKYTMKRLAKYEKMESPSLGKVQLSPFVKTQLMVELKLDYELSPAGKSSFFASTEHVAGSSHISAYYQERPRSVSAAHITRKKPALRPSSAPNNLKAKRSDKKGKLQTLDGGFVILKLNRKLKPLHFTTEVQKRPERISHDESKILDNTDTYHRLPAAARRQDEQPTVAMEKGERTDQSRMQEEISNQDAQQVEKDNKVRFYINGHVLPYDPNTRKYIPLDETVMPEGERIETSTIDSKDNVLKEKESFIPLSIEDEIEKPNAKIIQVDLPKAKPLTPMKMSETHPVLCNNERYLQKLILDKYVNQYGDKGFSDTCVVFTHLNPILQNNYNETLTILQSPNFASKVTAKKKKKPTTFSIRQILSAEVSSREKKHCNPMHSQIGKPVGQKMPGSFTNANRPITKEAVKEKYVSQPIHKNKKYEFVVCGVHLKTDVYHEIVSADGISGTRSQVLDSLDKSITPTEAVPKKRVLFVDYIPISKPVKIYTYGDKLSYEDSSLPVNNYSVINDCTEGIAIKKGRSDVNQDASDKKAFLDKTSLDSMEFPGSCHPFSFEDDSEISSSTISTFSSKGFQTEVSTTFKSQKGEQQPVILSPSRVISIPTAQCDASEPNKDLPVQKIIHH
ncbi:uncharacterized protein C1orf141 homolog [Heteronotia binoei]|uniref:uncharacterized protein C1orf141 homolog n=1 Tax=Heteronotia binoei TaxID=13085 RepID=UPI00292DBDF3|nr:uncharacterized protein C1orf141 homolog [Heteronotia binoei]